MKIFADRSLRRVASASILLVCLSACSSPAGGDPSQSLNDVDKARLGSLKPPANANQALKTKTVQPRSKGQAFVRAEAAIFNGRRKGSAGNITDTEQQTTVTDVNFEFGSDSDGDGAAHEEVDAQIDLTGLGKHQVKIDQKNFPTMSSKPDKVTITDQTTGNTRIFLADQDLYNYTVSDGTQELKIQTLPDGSWTINGEAAATPQQAAQLAIKSPLLADASIHGLSSLYQMLDKLDKVPLELKEPETMIPICCTCGNVNTSDAAYGDPRPLLKELIRLKRQLNKPGKGK